ncbi:MAG: hypothetical protein KTR28_09035 [Micavibrio sp.]|nr:hypothetical protein [Micavibrio sp.]
MNLKKLLPIAAFCVSFSTEAYAERKIVENDGMVAYAEGNICHAPANIIIKTDNPSDFSGNKIKLQKLIGGLQVPLSIECSKELPNLIITGFVSDRKVFQGIAYPDDEWRLVEGKQESNPELRDIREIRRKARVRHRKHFKANNPSPKLPPPFYETDNPDFSLRRTVPNVKDIAQKILSKSGTISFNPDFKWPPKSSNQHPIYKQWSNLEINDAILNDNIYKSLAHHSNTGKSFRSNQIHPDLEIEQLFPAEA